MNIGITFGVFDLFHEGHKKALKFCLERCDYLIVGLYTDYWVRVQKGHGGRPVWSYEKRKEVLDRFFQEQKVNYRIIKMDSLDIDNELRFADIFFKGVEQKNMRWSGTPNIILVPYTEGISTTSIIKNTFKNE